MVLLLWKKKLNFKLNIKLIFTCAFLFQMVQCGKCDHWIHATCENISDETYEILSELPEDSVVFNCRLCAPQPPGAVPPWRQAITDYTLQSFAKVSGSYML